MFTTRPALLCLWILLGATTSLLADPQGAIIYRGFAKAEDELAVVREYTRIDSFKEVVNFVDAEKGQKIRVMRENYVLHISYLDLYRETVASPYQIEQLEAQHRDLTRAMERFPQAEAVLRKQLAAITEARRKLDQGFVLIDGIWLLEDDYLAGKAVPEHQTVKRLVIGGKEYRSVRLLTANDGQVRLLHESGILTVSMDELSAAQITSLNSTSRRYQLSIPAGRG